MPEVRSLSVALNGRRVGVINRLGGDRHLFSFEQDYIDDPQRPTLSLAFKGRHGGLVTATRPVSQRLPPFFANLLPEGHLRAYLAKRAGVKPEREFFLLTALGADLPGAVTVAPMDEGSSAADDGAQVREPQGLHFSLAGVQLKFSAVNEATGGLTIPVDGEGGSWIVKLPSAQHPAVAENEHAMLELARATGIDVPRNRLVDIDAIGGLPDDTARLQGKALAVERFDRAAGGRRIHMEDFAQIFGRYPTDKYEGASYANIASVLSAETGDAGVEAFVRRLVFSVVIGNADMHLKNWSLLYPDGRTPVLAPAYDFVSTVAYLPDDALALGFGGSRSLTGIEPHQIRRFADTARLAVSPLARLVSDTAGRIVENWKVLEQKRLLPVPISKAIGRHIETAAANILRSFA
ncbi:type II toxin-antitoxin system HipA family toxin [Reyranella sp.]|uniref:type II toxin-antitoxin system HipA family toxin n=1 Tax=Reyranella sp. TaxID=1929291 RepID=UPI003BAD66EB